MVRGLGEEFKRSKLPELVVTFNSQCHLSVVDEGVARIESLLVDLEFELFVVEISSNEVLADRKSCVEIINFL